MIRAAKFQDAPEIERLIREQHAASKYAGRVDISDKAIEALILGAIAQAGQRGPQGTHVVVAERGGKVVGVMIGALDRVYHIGTKLTANDIFLINTGAMADTLAMVDSYIAWASGIRTVLEIVLSWSDALPGAEKIAALAKRKGFSKSGESFELRLDSLALGEAA